MTTKEAQELLALAGIPVGIDGQDGPQTRFARAAFLATHPGQVLDAAMPVAPDQAPPVVVDRAGPLSAAVLAHARWYLAARAREVGGNNMGPWVRRFLSGSEGSSSSWCAGFAACTCLQEASTALGTDAALAVAHRYRSPWCPSLLDHAHADGRAVTDLAQVRPGWLVLFVGPTPDGIRARHVGIVEYVDPAAGLVLTIEGNSGDGSDPSVRDRVARHIRGPADGMVFVDLDR